MSLDAAFIASENRLDLTLQDDLDLTLADEIFKIISELPQPLQTCIIDLTQLGRIFDSGIALLWLLNEKLKSTGATVVILSDHPEILERVPHIMSNVLSVVPLDRAQAASDLTRYARRARSA